MYTNMDEDIFGPIKNAFDKIERKKIIPNVSGLRYIQNWISTDRANALTYQIDYCQWTKEISRRTQQYGYRYDYFKSELVPEDKKPIPLWIIPLISKLYDEKIFPTMPDQVIIDEYYAGVGIADHIDCIPCFGETIATLSLGSSTTINMSDKSGNKLPLFVEANSLVIFQGNSRYNCYHGIEPKLIDIVDGKRVTRGRRLSLTFRKVKMKMT